MESYIPTRPSSDLHRRLSARKQPPLPMETQRRAFPGPPGRNRQRSSSFPNLGQTLSRLMPSNRPEKGGTARPMDNKTKDGDSPSPPKTLVEIFSRIGRANEKEDDGEEIRRTKSWSPKKVAMMADDADDGYQRPSKSKKPSTLKRLWDLHKAVNIDDETDDFLQHPDRLRSDARELRRAEQKTPNANTTLTVQQNPIEHVFSVTGDIQESVATLKRSQQIYEEKKARREERRSFRESDDFIGVQGANPRTGYPDPSTATSSSGGDIIGESIRQKLAEDEKRMASASREYQAALERRENALKELEIQRERKRRERKERAEKKRAQLRARVRKDGRWKNDGNTWSMVSEPGLSPIMQSVAGTPTYETPSQRGPMTPITTKEESVATLSARIEEDYFYRAPAPPKSPTKYRTPHVESGSNSPMSRKNIFHPLRTPSEKPKLSILALKADSLYDNVPGTPTRSDQTMTLAIRQKEFGSAILRRRDSSSETIIHNIKTNQPLPVELPDNSVLAVAVTPSSVNARVQVATPGETTHIPSSISPPICCETFLDVLRVENEGFQESEATVTSYQSALMSQALTQLPLLQSPKDTSRANRIHSLQDFPPVILKDPMLARISSNPQSRWIPTLAPVLKSAPMIPEQEPGNKLQITTTPITTIIGFEEAPCRLSQVDGSKDASEEQVSPQRLTMANSSIPTPNFHLKEMPNGMPNSGSQLNQADIGTSLAHHLPVLSTPTKRPIPRLCQPVSLELTKLGPKGTLTFTSTFPQQQSPLQKSAAWNAAQTAFLGASPRRLGKDVKIRSSSLVSPKAKSKEVGQGRKIFSGGNVDIGDLSRTREDLEKNPQLLRKRIEQARQLGGPSSNGGEDGFIVWRTDVEKRVRFANEKPPTGRQKFTQSPPNKKLKGTQSIPSKKPKDSGTVEAKVSAVRKLYEMVMWAIGVAFWFVSPVYNPRSGLRRRWARKELTWGDILLIGAAGMVGGGVFLAMVLLARLFKVALRIMKWCIKVCKVLAHIWRSVMD